MCGIAGVFLVDRPADAGAVAAVLRMLDAEVHRGPNDWGIDRRAGRFTRRVTANVLRAFAGGPAAARYPAHDNLGRVREWAGDPIASQHDLWA